MPDIAVVYGLCLVSLGIAVHKIFVDFDTETMERNTVLQSPQKVFDFGKDFIVVHYMGHGERGIGGWCFKEPGASTHTFINHLIFVNFIVFLLLFFLRLKEILLNFSP